MSRSNNNNYAGKLKDVSMEEILACLDLGAEKLYMSDNEEVMDDFDDFVIDMVETPEPSYDSDSLNVEAFTFAKDADRQAILRAMQASPPPIVQTNAPSGAPQPSQRGRVRARVQTGPAAAVVRPHPVAAAVVVGNVRLAFKPDGKIHYPTTAANIANAHGLAGKPTYDDMSRCLVVFQNLSRANGTAITHSNTVTMYGLLYDAFAKRSLKTGFMSRLSKPNNIAQTQKSFIAHHCAPSRH